MIDTAQDRLDTIAARLSSASAHAGRAATDALLADIAANPMTPPARFAAMVAAAKDYIAEGDIFQVVLARTEVRRLRKECCRTVGSRVSQYPYQTKQLNKASNTPIT